MFEHGNRHISGLKNSALGSFIAIQVIFCHSFQLNQAGMIISIVLIVEAGVLIQIKGVDWIGPQPGEMPKKRQEVLAVIAPGFEGSGSLQK